MPKRMKSKPEKVNEKYNYNNHNNNYKTTTAKETINI